MKMNLVVVDVVAVFVVVVTMMKKFRVVTGRNKDKRNNFLGNRRELVGVGEREKSLQLHG